MTRRFVTGALVGAMAVGVSTGVAAQANPTNSGYVLSATAPPDNNVVRNGAGNLCWRTGLLDAGHGDRRVRSGSGAEAARARSRRRP